MAQQNMNKTILAGIAVFVLLGAVLSVPMMQSVDAAENKEKKTVKKTDKKKDTKKTTKKPSSKAASEVTVDMVKGSDRESCEKGNKCYSPFEAKVTKGRTITWVNKDAAAHTATSGTITNGPDGKVDTGLFVAENLEIPARRHLARAQVAARVAEVLREVELADKAEMLAGNLSHGDQRHLDIDIALATAPELLLLDEPTAGMPPHETSGTVDLIRRLRDRHGYTIVLIEHKMDIVMSISDRVTVMRQGRHRATVEKAQTSPGELASLMMGGGPEFAVCAAGLGEPGPVPARDDWTALARSL